MVSVNGTTWLKDTNMLCLLMQNLVLSTETRDTTKRFSAVLIEHGFCSLYHGNTMFSGLSMIVMPLKQLCCMNMVEQYTSKHHGITIPAPQYGRSLTQTVSVSHWQKHISVTDSPAASECE